MKPKNIVIVTQSAEHLFPSEARKIEGLKDQPEIIFPSRNKEGFHRFPDGEVYLRVPGLKRVDFSTKIVIVHSGYPDPNGGLMELFMILEIIKKYAKSRPCHIHLVLTCMPYARQDNAYYDGELNMAKMLLEMLVHKHGVNHITTFDAHFAGERWVKKWVRENPNFTNIPLAKDLMEQARMIYPDIVFMTPDAGSKRRIGMKKMAGAAKTRFNSFDVSVKMDDATAEKIRGKTVGAVDDILSTGNTLVRFAEQAKKLGAKEVVDIISHGVSETGVKRIRAEFGHLFFSDTVGSPEANIHIRKILDAECIVRSFGKKGAFK